VAFACVVAAALAPRAGALPAYTPTDRPGPALDVAPAQLRASLKCTAGVGQPGPEPVLLNPATGVTAEQNYSWNWERALNALGIEWCAYTPPHHTLDDIQVSGQYLVYAIRTMHAMAGRRIAILGHSQGAMSMRWALRFWPDTRAMVDDVIGFAGTNHGTTQAGLCPTGCPPADWQQFAGSSFITALNSYAETFPGISYTEVYSRWDEVAKPADNDRGTSSLHTGGGMITNVAIQDLCPRDPDEHLLIGTVDPVAYALAIDALTHPGPADPGRVPRSVCSQLTMPGVNPLNLANYIQSLAAAPGLLATTAGLIRLPGVPEVQSEPPLACYVLASCSAPAPLRASLRVSPAVAMHGVRTRFTFTARRAGRDRGRALAGATIRFAQRSIRTTRTGRASITAVLHRSRRPYRALLTLRGRVLATAWVRVR
jgi:hypothetical protein